MSSLTARRAPFITGGLRRKAFWTRMLRVPRRVVSGNLGVSPLIVSAAETIGAMAMVVVASAVAVVVAAVLLKVSVIAVETAATIPLWFLEFRSRRRCRRNFDARCSDASVLWLFLGGA